MERIPGHQLERGEMVQAGAAGDRGDERTRGNSFKLKGDRFSLDIRKILFLVWHWNSLPRETPHPWMHSRQRLDGF